MCKDNSGIWLILLVVILFSCGGNKGNSSTPLNFNTFFELDSSAPFGV